MTDTATAFEAFTAALDPHLGDQVKKLRNAGADVVFAYSLATALRDFQSATRAAGVGEEHRTSALMGFIGTSLGVFNLLARLSGLEGDTQLLWHAANRRSSQLAGKGESESGGDFGIAIPSPSAGPDMVRLCFFQAKNGSDKGKINLRREPSSSALSEIDQHNRHARMLHWISSGTNVSVKSVGHDYQIYKLASTQEQGRAAAHNSLGCDWVHYAIWSSGAPAQFSLEQVRAALESKTFGNGGTGDFTSWLAKAHELGIKPISFALHLARAFTAEHVGWIEIPLADAEVVVGRFVELGADWYTIDTEQGGVAQQLTLKHPLVDVPERIGAASHVVTNDLGLLATPPEAPYEHPKFR